MPEDVLFKTEEQRTRAEIAEALVAAADQIESGDVHEREHSMAAMTNGYPSGLPVMTP